MRVMTFNVRGFYHPDDGANQWHNREQLNIDAIAQQAPHLVGLQEAQTGNLKAYNRRLTDFHWTAWPEYGDAPPHEWPAILWRPEHLHPLDSGGFWLSETPDRHSRSWDTDCIRSAAWIRFRCLEADATFVHLNTHLDHVSELARIEGARLIVRRLDALQRDDDACVVTGDFNDVPDSDTYGVFSAAGFVDAHAAAGNTVDPAESYTNHGYSGYPWGRSEDTPKRIDWILVRSARGAGADVRSCTIVRAARPPVFPSDHYPVVAQIEFNA